MRKLLAVVLVCVISIAVVGCGEKAAESANAAIEKAKTIETVKEKADYLVGQAKAFYKSKEFQQAVEVAQYVLKNVDKNSEVAKDILEKAKEALTAAAGQAKDALKKKL